MRKETFKDGLFYGSVFVAWVASLWLIPVIIGENGLWGSWFATHTVLKLAGIWILMAHLTICCMSICFHRAHTHQAVRLNPIVDGVMQVFLWVITSMSKLDWVSVHVYHHVHSDTVKDPHSPKHKGLLHVFFKGAADYSQAKSWPEVLKIKSENAGKSI